MEVTSCRCPHRSADTSAGSGLSVPTRAASAGFASSGSERPGVIFTSNRDVSHPTRGVPGTNWLNDGVNGFLSERGEFSFLLELDALRVMVARPEYLLAMKCLALRIATESHDEDDIRYLLRLLGIGNYEAAVAVISRYYPLERFPQKNLYALAELLPQQS